MIEVCDQRLARALARFSGRAAKFCRSDRQFAGGRSELRDGRMCRA